MKIPTLPLWFLVAVLLASCQPPVTDSEVSLPSTTTARLPVPTQVFATASHTSEPISTPDAFSALGPRENATRNCFVQTELIPGQSNMGDVRALWGDPAEEITPYEGSVKWSYDFEGVPLVRFESRIVESITYYLDGCSIDKIIEVLGPPAKVEIQTIISCVNLSAFIIRTLHYPKHGFSFSQSCLGGAGMDCHSFYAGDLMDTKDFYGSAPAFENSTGFNSSKKFFEWPGFDVSVVDQDKQ